ncbi:MAG: hypothetical protein ACT4NP_03785 [Pseudonocardiales bacterium]
MNLAQRLQDLARPAGTTVASEATMHAARDEWRWEQLGACPIKGRQAPVLAYRLGPFGSRKANPAGVQSRPGLAKGTP